MLYRIEYKLIYKWKKVSIGGLSKEIAVLAA